MTRFERWEKVCSAVQAIDPRTGRKMAKKDDSYHDQNLTKYERKRSKYFWHIYLTVFGTQCGICGDVFEENPKGPQYRPLFNLDHDHKTNRVRGLLCFSCNHFMHWFDKYPHTFDEFVAGAFEYARLAESATERIQEEVEKRKQLDHDIASGEVAKIYNPNWTAEDLAFIGRKLKYWLAI